MSFFKTELSKDPQLNARNELSTLKTPQIQRTISWLYLSFHLHIATSTLTDYFLLEMLFALVLKMLFSQAFPISLTAPCSSNLMF